MSTDKPGVSVIMSVKDGEKYLRQAIDSILKQTFINFEFIIIDDGSTDGSMKILNEYTDPRIKIYSNEVNIGLPRSLNIALGYAQCEYIARMDYDDISLPDRFKMQVKFLDAHPEVSVLGTGFMLIEEDGTAISEEHFPDEADLIRWSLCFCNPIAHTSVMMRRSRVMELGGYDSTLPQPEDYDLWWRLSLISELANLEPVCVLLRQHSAQMTKVRRSEQIEMAAQIDQKYLSGLLGKPVSREVIRKLWLKDFTSLDDALSVNQLIFDLLNNVIPSINSKVHKRIIFYDALSSILTNLFPHLAQPGCWLQIWMSVSLNPAASMEIVGRLIAKRILNNAKRVRRFVGKLLFGMKKDNAN